MNRLIRHYARRFSATLLQWPLLVANPLSAWLFRRFARRVAREVQRRGLPPRQVHIENTNHCNAECVMCPHKEMERAKLTMERDLFVKGLEDAGQLGVKWIQPQFFGEPFLDKRYREKLEQTLARGFHVSLFCNGSLLNTRNAGMLIELGVDELFVSIDSVHPEVYEAIRPGLKYSTVVGNVVALMEEKRRRGVQKPKVTVMFVEFERNHGEVGEYFRFWRDKVDGVNISRSHDWAGAVEVGGKTIAPVKRRRLPCPSLWDQLVVNSSGRVLPCCADYEGKLVLGDINRQSLSEIWQGEALARLRQLHLEGRFDEIPLCANCYPNDLPGWVQRYRSMG
ncbi:radical SAM/SPASM domain-containing protein [Endothiovibrio diazotrophicus]